MRRRLLILLLALLGVFAAPGLASADNGAPSKADLGLSPDANAAIAYNTKDGSALFQFAFALRHVMNGVVDQENVAVAYSKCTSCQTTAIAIEIVLVHGPTKTVSPQNAAIAVNESCTLCDTFASAYQFVIGVDGPVHLTRRGLYQLWQIRQEILSWSRQGVKNDVIKARLPVLMDRVRAILRDELKPVRDEGGQGDENSNDQGQGQARDGPGGQTADTQTGTVQDTVTTPTTNTSTDTTPTTTTGPATTTAPTTTGTTTTTP